MSDAQGPVELSQENMHALIVGLNEQVVRKSDAPAAAPQLLSKLKEALAKAQLEIYNPQSNRDVSFEKNGVKSRAYKYAELCAVTEIIREPLSKNGLSYTQSPIEFEDGRWRVVTTLMHDSGEEKDFHYPLITTESNMKREQQFAGGFTYAKRQALKGIFGIADDTEDHDAHVDDDVTIKRGGKEKEEKKKEEKKQPPTDAKEKARSPGKISSDQLTQLTQKFQQTMPPWTTDQMRNFSDKAFGIKNSRELTETQFNLFMSALEMTPDAALVAYATQPPEAS